MPKSAKHFHRGNSLQRSGKLATAGSAYARHLRTNPTDKTAHFNLGVTLQAARQTAAAIQSYTKALELDPYYPEALNNIGILLHQEGDLRGAGACFARALAARPNYDDAEYNYATAASDAGDYDAALLHFSRVLERNPKRADAWNNLGKVFLALCHPADALQAFEWATTLHPDLEEALWNLATAQLTLGQLADAWKNFEFRGKPRHSHIPRWDGAPLADKSLLIHAEQGMGDAIQFSRYCSHVKSEYSQFECHAPLVKLFTQLDGIRSLISLGAPVNADVQIPLMSLPGVFGTTIETIPRSVPYLSADADLIAHWRTRIVKRDHSLNVGLVWAGSPKHKNDANRSVPPQLLSALAQVPHTAFYCIQQKPLSADIGVAHPLRFADVFDDVMFTDTAAILMNLDLTISVDTATAHLAGALGRPIWTLLPYAPDWRWMLDRTDTPWYPTMRLFRQPQRNDWASVMDTVAGELAQLAAQRYSGTGG